MSLFANNSLEGQVALVTGASRGIGLAIARAYAAAGAKIALASRKQEGLDLAAEAIRKQGGEALPIAAHSGDGDAVLALRQAQAAGIDVQFVPWETPPSAEVWLADVRLPGTVAVGDVVPVAVTLQGNTKQTVDLTWSGAGQTGAQSVALDARPDTSQFHIIQPQVVK